MELQDIRKIVELMNEHDLSLFHLEKGDFNLKLKKGADAEAIQAAMAAIPQMAAPAQVAAPAAPAAAAPATPAAPASDGTPIESPMVGTFYRSPGPDQASFVNVGDTIAEGQTICIIEAMKVMNEIKAEVSGTVTAIHVDDSTPVQFGDLLFSVK